MIKKLIQSILATIRFLAFLLVFVLLSHSAKPNAYTSYNSESQQLIQKEARGIVTDEDGVPLKGVIIIVSKSLIHTTTDKDGRFSLSNIPEGASITFMLKGYKTHTLPPLMTSNTTIKVKMLKDPACVEPSDTSMHLSEQANNTNQVNQVRKRF